MKNLLIATLFVFTLMTGCKDDTPVEDTTPDSGTAIDQILGKYTCNWVVFSASTGVESDKGTFECEIRENTDDSTRFDFRIDGLTLLMTGSDIITVADGYTFSIPEQTVKNFGDLVGRPILNIDGQTTKVDGHVDKATGNITCFCERARKIGQDDDLFEFKFVKK
ncbi:MAG: hypothetical protein ACI9JN_002539 [Bacteroidia bacterium]|jgi:hypothetical protein